MATKQVGTESRRCEHAQCGRVATHAVSTDGRGRLLCARHVESYKKTGSFVLPLKPPMAEPRPVKS